jgi:hypothetical protein
MIRLSLCVVLTATTILTVSPLSWWLAFDSLLVCVARIAAACGALSEVELLSDRVIDFYATAFGSDDPHGYDASSHMYSNLVLRREGSDFAAANWRATKSTKCVAGDDALLPVGAGQIPHALQLLQECGFAVLAPGLLPRLQLSAARASALRLLADHEPSAGPWPLRRGRWAPRPHADGRGDLVAPFDMEPFGRPLVEALADLIEPVLAPLLGPDAALDFVSLLYVVPNASSQSWHGEGRHPLLVDGGSLRARTLKVQIVLHDLEREHGMVHFVSRSHRHSSKRPQAIAQHSAFDTVAPQHQLVPSNLEAGSVVIYNPAALHCGGANHMPTTKVVLDVLFKSRRFLDGGDDTPGRFALETEEGARAYRQYRLAWDEVAAQLRSA